MTCQVVDAEDGQTPCRLEIKLDASLVEPTAMQVCRALRAGDPAVYVGHGRLEQNILVVNPFCLVADQVEPLARRLVEEIGTR